MKFNMINFIKHTVFSLRFWMNSSCGWMGVFCDCFAMRYAIVKCEHILDVHESDSFQKSQHTEIIYARAARNSAK